MVTNFPSHFSSGNLAHICPADIWQMCELLSFFCCSSSSSASSFLSHVHFQFVTISFVRFPFVLPCACRPGGHVLAFSLSLCRCTQTISVTYHILVPPPQQSASQSFAMLASFWTLFTVDFLHNFAAWLPVSGPRQFCSFCLPFLTFSAHLSFIHECVCVLAFGEYVVARAACNLLKTIQMTKSTRQATLRTSGHSLLVARHNASNSRLHYQVG